MILSSMRPTVRSTYQHFLPRTTEPHWDDAVQPVALPPTVLVGIENPLTRARVVHTLEDHVFCNVAAEYDGYHLIERIADAVLDADRPERALNESAPGLIIADAILPGCTGLSLLAGLRDLGWETPVILLIPPNDEDARRQAWNGGATAVVVDPVDVCALQTLARHLLIFGSHSADEFRTMHFSRSLLEQEAM